MTSPIWRCVRSPRSRGDPRDGSTKGRPNRHPDSGHGNLLQAGTTSPFSRTLISLSARVAASLPTGDSHAVLRPSSGGAARVREQAERLRVPTFPPPTPVQAHSLDGQDLVLAGAGSSRRGCSRRVTTQREKHRSRCDANRSEAVPVVKNWRTRLSIGDTMETPGWIDLWSADWVVRDSDLADQFSGSAKFG